MIVTDWKNGLGSLTGTYISLERNTPIKDYAMLRIGQEIFCTVIVDCSNKPTVPIIASKMGETQNMCCADIK